jgi:hypothetical protein
MQKDGNLVVYGHGKALWQSHTYNHPGAYLVMQQDRNLVIYSAGGRPSGSQEHIFADGLSAYAVITAEHYGSGVPRRVSSARSAVSYAFLIAWVASRLADETILNGCRRVVDVAIGELAVSWPCERSIT